MENKVCHFLMVPFTGLGLYNGFRGNRFLRNRIKIFKQFVIPSLQAQTNKNFILWICWRYEEKKNHQVIELEKWIRKNTDLKAVFTYAGIPFYDDKYNEVEARDRLLSAIHGSMGELINVMDEADTILMTIQPSDDCYNSNMVQEAQDILLKPQTKYQAFGYKHGYIIDYKNLKVKEWNPQTTPPFYTIKFPREIFIDPLKHWNYTGIKQDCGKYKKGTAIPSHEYVGDALNYYLSDERGFLVGTHSDNISTVFDHPYAGNTMQKSILQSFGLDNISELKIPFSLRKILFNKFPYKVKRKLRYLAGEKKWILRPIFNLIYNFLRG